MSQKPRKPWLVNLAFIAVLLLLVYPLSYAPVVRLGGGNQDVTPTVFMSMHGPIIDYADGSRYPIYVPVDWLIDHTPLRQPLFWWAALFGVKEDFQSAYNWRTAEWVPL